MASELTTHFIVLYFLALLAICRLLYLNLFFYVNCYIIACCLVIHFLDVEHELGLLAGLSSLRIFLVVFPLYT